MASRAYRGRAERPLAAPAPAVYASGGELFFVALGFGLSPRELGSTPGELAAALAREDVEAPGFGDLVVRRVDGAFEHLLDGLFRHRVRLDTPDAPARPYRLRYLQKSSLLLSKRFES